MKRAVWSATATARERERDVVVWRLLGDRHPHCGAVTCAVDDDGSSRRRRRAERDLRKKRAKQMERRVRCS